MDREEADVPIVGIIFFIIHVIYTMLHLFIYCYVGETLLGEVVCYPTNILVFSSPKEKWNTGFSEHRYWPVNVPLQLVRFTIETSSFINDRDTPCKRVVSNNSWKIQPVLPWIFQRCEWKKQILWKFQIFNFNQVQFRQVLKTSAGYLSVLLAMKDRLVEEKWHEGMIDCFFLSLQLKKNAALWLYE